MCLEKFIVRSSLINPGKKHGTDIDTLPCPPISHNKYTYLPIAASAPQTQLTLSFIFHLFVFWEVFWGTAQFRGSSEQGRSLSTGGHRFAAQVSAVQREGFTVGACPGSCRNDLAFLISGPCKYLCNCLSAGPCYQMQQQASRLRPSPGKQSDTSFNFVSLHAKLTRS